MLASAVISIGVPGANPSSSAMSFVAETATSPATEILPAVFALMLISTTRVGDGEGDVSGIGDDVDRDLRRRLAIGLEFHCGGCRRHHRERGGQGAGGCGDLHLRTS